MKKLLFIPACALVLASGSAFAGTSVNTVHADLSVPEACELTASDIDFGSVGTLSVAGKDAASSIKVYCTSGTAYTVKMYDAADAAKTDFTMVKGTDELHFKLYSDASRTTLWDSSTGVSGVGTGQEVTLNDYGRIPAQTSVPAGAYAASMRAGLTF